MPAGRGVKCEACYWRTLATKRAATASEVFSKREQANIFCAFGEWLSNEVGEQKAAVTVLRYLPFFVDVASLGTMVPSYQELLEKFSTLGLRRNLLAMRFLEMTNRIVVNEQQKRDASDLRRIDAALSGAPSVGRLREALDGYHAVLRSKLAAGKISVRSIRLSLTPAAALIAVAAKSDHQLPEQADLSRYLSVAPGQRAAVTGFVSFLKMEYKAQLEVPAKASNGDTFEVRRSLERAIAAQLKSGVRNPAECTALLVNALRYFHHMPARTAKSVAVVGILTEAPDGNVFVLHAKTKYRLPREISVPLMMNKVSANHTLDTDSRFSQDKT
ncbi:hypothetical protein ACDA63_14450 [Uliginosibacterium sp. sgz301328]|uniref:hypothetical protein n=1 Tax=Uliginosibacterium sp. sgz301328 TaxID=3243764 RepID=UPI00359CEAB2